jgi:hypothetical protein
MTPKQILDSFSETLMQDERILSAQERALLGAMLQHAKSSTIANEEIREAVQMVIASAVGEIVAQRAFAVLGESIVERILEGPFSASLLPDVSTKTQPQPPNKSPGPGVKAPVKEPPKPLRDTPVPPPVQPQPPNQPLRGPAPPSPVQPQPPNHGIDRTVVSHANVGVVERAAILPAKCVVLDEFLAPQELDELTRFTLEHEGDFSASEVVSPVAPLTGADGPGATPRRDAEPDSRRPAADPDRTRHGGFSDCRRGGAGHRQQ